MVNTTDGPATGPRKHKDKPEKSVSDTASSIEDSRWGGAAGREAIKNWFEVNSELTRFMSTRLRKDIAMLNAYAACRSTRDVAEVWQRATSAAVHDYAEELDRLIAINLRRNA